MLSTENSCKVDFIFCSVANPLSFPSLKIVIFSCIDPIENLKNAILQTLFPLLKNRHFRSHRPLKKIVASEKLPPRPS